MEQLHACTVSGASSTAPVTEQPDLCCEVKQLENPVPSPASGVSVLPCCAGSAEGLSASRWGLGLPCWQQSRQLCSAAARDARQAWGAGRTGCCLPRNLAEGEHPGWPGAAVRLHRCSQALKVPARVTCNQSQHRSSTHRLPAGFGAASPAANCSVDAAHRLPAGVGLPQHCIHRQAALAAARGPSQEQGLPPPQRRQRVQCLHRHPRDQAVTTARTGGEAPPEMAATQRTCLRCQADAEPPAR